MNNFALCMLLIYQVYAISDRNVKETELYKVLPKLQTKNIDGVETIQLIDPILALYKYGLNWLRLNHASMTRRSNSRKQNLEKMAFVRPGREENYFERRNQVLPALLRPGKRGLLPFGHYNDMSGFNKFKHVKRESGIVMPKYILSRKVKTYK